MKWFFRVRLFSINIGNYRFSPGLFVTIITVITASVMYSLGLWQISRGEYKDNLQQKIVSRQNNPPLTFNELPYGEDARNYLPVRFSGSYDTRKMIFLDNRIHNGVVGYDVYSRFELNNGKNVLVNRGFVAQGKSRQQLPEIETPGGDLEIHGLLENPPSKGVVLVEDLHQETRWPMVMQYIDLAEIEDKFNTKLMGMIVRLGKNEAGGLIYNQPVLNLNSSKNYAYAFQWFAMMTAVISLFLVLNTSKRKADNE